MMNVAAMTLLLNNRRGGFGVSLGDGWGEPEQAPERYDIPEARGGSRIDGTSVLTAYLDGRCTITAFGTSSAQNLFGEKLKTSMKSVPAYKAYAEQKINMVTPPSFMEKMMLLRRTLKDKKAARMLSRTTLGATSLAAGMISLAARSYGRARGFVLEKLLDREMPQTFTERLIDLKSRAEFKSDVKKLGRLEKLNATIDENRNLQSKTSYMDGMTRHRNQTTSRLLIAYLYGDRDIDEKGVSNVRSNAQLRETVVSLKEVEQTLDKTTAQINMVDPPTRTESFLMKAGKWLENRQRYSSVDSTLTQASSAVIAKVTERYIRNNEQKNPEFKGRLSMFSRFSDIRLRRQYEQDAARLQTLQRKMTGR